MKWLLWGLHQAVQHSSSGSRPSFCRVLQSLAGGWQKLRIAALASLFAGVGPLLAVDASQQPGSTFSNVSYGPHPRNVMDFWKAAGEGPRPLLVYIHGGGWITGDKGQKMPSFQPFLDKGIC